MLLPDLYSTPLDTDLLTGLRALAEKRPEHDTLLADMLARFFVPVATELLALRTKLEGTPP